MFMTIVKSQKAMLQRLKKQLATLRRKEKSTRIKLRSALKKVSKLARVSQKQLNEKNREVKGKIAAAEAAVYVKLANSLKTKAKTTKHRKN
jgi:hypothetical protein